MGDVFLFFFAREFFDGKWIFEILYCSKFGYCSPAPFSSKPVYLIGDQLDYVSKVYFPSHSVKSLMLLLRIYAALEKEMVTHSSIPAWRIPWTDEPGRQATVHGVTRVGHDLATKPPPALGMLTVILAWLILVFLFFSTTTSLHQLVASVIGGWLLSCFQQCPRA